jgi:hypothetical protein
MTLHTTTDVEFLESIGVVPYDPEAFRESENDRVRTLILRGVAVLQFAGIIAALLWTSR